MSDNRVKAAVCGKDERGRFAPGNRYGAGNPYSREQARLRDEAQRTLPENWLGDLYLKLYLMAMNGDLKAMRMLLDQTVGKPAEAAHPDRLDADELDCFRKNAAPSSIERDAAAPPLSAALPAVRLVKGDKVERALGPEERKSPPDSDEHPEGTEQIAARYQRRDERRLRPIDANSDSEITGEAAPSSVGRDAQPETPGRESILDADESPQESEQIAARYQRRDERPSRPIDDPSDTELSGAESASSVAPRRSEAGPPAPALQRA